MKILSVLAVIICLYCISVSGDNPRTSSPVGSVNEAEVDHGNFDQEVLDEMMDGRKKLHQLTPEETAQEIRKLVSRMDSDADGRVGKEELVAWLQKVEDRSYQTEAAGIFEKEDFNGDGFITFNEFWEGTEGEEVPDDSDDEELNDAQQSVAVRFQAADENKDGKLDRSEFVPFIHPFRHEHMVGHLVEDQLVLYDRDQDGTLSLDEFTNSINPDNLPGDELPDWVQEQRVQFKEHLDSDHDGLLGYDEIKEWMAPNQKKFFEEEAKHLLNNVDHDQDGYLSLEEIEAGFSMFAESPVTDYGHVLHEEL